MVARRISLSQFQSKMRQAQQQQRRAIDEYNRKVRAHNAAVDKAKRETKRAIDDYNREVRTHNARVRSNKARLESALRSFNSAQRVPTRSTAQITYRSSVKVVSTAYVALEQRATSGYLGDNYNEVLDLAEREAANAVQLANALYDDASVESAPVSDDELTQELRGFDTDLADRWQGALFSLSPQNPDASRHFCTSARELISSLLDRFAPNSAVLAADSACDKTPNGTPSRRAKISYMLSVTGKSDAALSEFVDVDVESVISLFPVFNDGTHGSARKFSLVQLGHIRKRVENSVQFILRAAA